MGQNLKISNRTQDASHMGLAEAVSRLRCGTLTSEQLTRDCLARIAERESVVQAWAWLDQKRAIELAQQFDRERKNGDRRPLAGVPVGIKDVISTAGIPTEMGSSIYAGYIPERSGAVVNLLEQAGAFVLGKTVTTEFATQHPGKTRNPWNPAHTPGGSSSGSAAAVAAGFVPAAIGTQTRGSTIRPAAYCGVVGFKPSYGLIPTDGVFPQSHTLDHLGLFADTVGDVALLANCLMPLGGTLNMNDDGHLQFVEPERAPRLAAVRSPVWPLADEMQTENFYDSIRTLISAGAVVEIIELPDSFSSAMDAVKSIQLREIADLYAEKLAVWGELISDKFRNYVIGGINVTRGEYQEALMLRANLIQEFIRFSKEFDAVITPPAAGEAPVGLQFTGDASFCGIWTLCGAPAISIPSGFGPNGLPLGLQVVGVPNSDYSTLRTALWCERHLGIAQKCT